MKIDIPKVVTAVSMAEYAPELEGKNLYVWVNPPMARLHEYNDLVTALQTRELEEARKTLELEGPEEPKGPKGPKGLQKTFNSLFRWLNAKREHKAEGVDVMLLEWYAEAWNQGPEDSRWTIEELQKLEQQDPTFLSWMISQTWKARSEHVERKKKA